MTGQRRPWTTWGLVVAALLAVPYFSAGYFRARSFAALEPDSHWGRIAWLMIALVAVSLVLFILAVRRLSRSPAGASSSSTG